MGITELSLVEALLVALSGIVTVFIMLAVLCIMIPVISKVVSSIEGKSAPAPAAAPAAPAAAAPAPVPGGTYTGEVALLGCDEKTAAMVMAIVSHETGIPLDQLIFHKIKAL